MIGCVQSCSDPPAQALDCELTFTTGGDGGAAWGTEDWMPYYGPDMAAGGNIGADEQVWMQTSITVSDGQKMSFYWKVSSESGADYLKFYINDVLQHQISGNVDWQKKSYTFSGAGTKTLKWTYVKDSQNSAGEDKGWVDGLVIGSGSLIPPPNEYGEVLDCDLKFTSTGTEASDTWYADSGTTVEYYLNGDSAKSYSIGANEETCLQTIVESDSNETVKFYWKVSSEQGGDYLQFYIDGTLKDQISGEVDWTLKSYSVLAGTHTLKWRYVKNSSGYSGDDCGWVDFVQWTGPSPAQDPSNWQEIAYKHDVLGRRVEKKVDGYSTRYVYDGPHVIAEYDGNNNLLRKYIYGPGIDQPVSMIEVADANAVYYYHFDALGSVVALSDAAGDTVQTYEYSVYGEVAVEDANHTNPYMFAGVRYDIEIGLYYNRARYYNPFTGRFLQTDPIGYQAGMNWYAYCKNNPLAFADPWGASDVPTPRELLNIYYTCDVYTLVNGKPYWLDLMTRYLVGGGQPLIYEGKDASAFLLDDWQVKGDMGEQMTVWAKEYYRSGNAGYGCQGVWSVEEKFPVGFHEELSWTMDLTRFLIGGASLWMIGDVNVSYNQVTITAKFVLTDYMDLHPGGEGWQYLPDRFGTVMEEQYNAWVASHPDSDLPPAQPYPLFIVSDTVTVTFTFDDEGKIIKKEGWPWE